MTPEGWIRPGGTASCHVNWHYTQAPDGALMKWAYVAVDAQGYDFFAEALVPGRTLIRLSS